MTYSLCVFCGSSSPKSIEILDAIDKLIEKIVKVPNVNLVYGGAKIGVMGEVAEKFLAHQREVIGVMPEFLKNREVDHKNLTKFISTKTMHERKQKMYELSDGFLVLPGGYGTLDELFEASCWSQLEQHKKPIGVFNPKNFYGPMQQMIENMLSEGFISKEHKKIIHFAQSFEEVSHHLSLEQ